MEKSRNNGVSQGGGFCIMDMGLLDDFLARIDALSEAHEDREYRFKEFNNLPGDFWLFEEEDEEEILGGLLKVDQGRVYAISQDVYDLVETAFARGA